MQLVFNWHLTQRCNYSCAYCFAQWPCSEEIWKYPTKTNGLLTELAKGRKLKALNSIQQHNTNSDCRINFVGGEPLMLGERLVDIVKQAVNQHGFKASLITNGSLLERHLEVVDHLESLGFSIDSFSTEANRKIGRCTKSEITLTETRFKRLIQLVKERKPSIKIKINTVVNQQNWKEEVISRVSAIAPDKIKIFRQLPFGKQKGISDLMFETFLRNNTVQQPNVFIENNADMAESYLMIDPSGRFFQNNDHNGYSYSKPIHYSGFQSSFSQIRFIPERYLRRYKG